MLAIIFGLIFLYQLSFTVVTNVVEKKAAKYAQAEADKLANGDESAKQALMDAKENYYLDSVSNVNVYNLLVKKYTYRDAKEREINLGLDLKGGMNVTLEVSVKDIVNALAGANANDPTFAKAMQLATERQEKSEGDFVTLFGQAYEEVDPNAKLASIFLFEFKDKGITVNFFVGLAEQGHEVAFALLLTLGGKLHGLGKGGIVGIGAGQSVDDVLHRDFKGDVHTAL